ncbi:MAG: DNA mismatch repair endonuclease MutL [Candidatus Omnitrophota bacterium]|nr:DNA mismatch repair endonuclease MutL [Candidatus Omnitrophota bacterium]
MPKVHILSPDLVSKIAAGEVIERPASVVKELLENSLDAGADHIELNLTESGKTLIHLKDNGHGIDHEDLEKIFLRHATSKIENADDLYAIQSLGFRGEALYSVAAIADVVLKTRATDADSGPAGGGTGWEIHLRGGTKLGLKPATFPGQGTDIEIKELFFNTPARKKFLKPNTTELHQILDVVIPYTLLNTQVRFRLTHQGKELLNLAPAPSLITRVADTLNLEEKFLTEVNESWSQLGVSCHAVFGDMNIKRARRDLQFIFVNNRPVQNKSIAFHLNQIYRLIMPEGTSPFFLVHLTIPAADIDVNIHPTKREVKIKNEQQICSFLRALCEQTLMQKSRMKQVMSGQSLQDEITATFHTNRRVTYETSEHLEPDPAVKSPHDDYAYPQSPEIPSFFIPSENVPGKHMDGLQAKLTNARYVGAFLNKFQIFDAGPSLLIVDQHAAAERITYERLIEQMQKGNLEIQPLLSPILIKLTPQELLLWEEMKEELEKCGLETNQWDHETIAIQAHAVLLKDPEKAVRCIFAGEIVQKNDFETLARRACRSSIMAGDYLNKEKAESQRQQLLNCLDPLTCPHGRPTVIELSEVFLDKQFLRT